jgi:hypothetical protein
MKTKQDTKKIMMHIIYPSLLSVAFFINAALPVTVLGCVNRGLVALVVALISGIAALGAVVLAIRERMSGKLESSWWILTTLILTIPVLALIRLA